MLTLASNFSKKMAANMEMSEWIKFFTAAGIPAGPAAKYSVVFLDNRIQKSMLMDLTKEYLKEMGISIMGDVIAILKYAKTAHIKYENEKPAITALSTNPDAKVEVKRQTTPGNRMLEHYMRKEGIMEGNSSKVTVSPSMAVRLGAVPVVVDKAEEALSSTKKTSSGVLGDAAEVVPVKRPRMVKPEEEGKYVISLPKGTTPKTMKILEQKQQLDKGSEEEQKSSVFARLGAGNSPTVSQQTKKAEISPAKTPTGPSVFNRLGGQRTRTVSDSSEGTVEYRGVLKSLSSPSLTPKPAAATVKVIKPTSVKVTLGDSMLVSSMPEASLQTRLGKKTTAAPKQVTTSAVGAKSVMARLGAPAAKKNVVATAPPSTKQKVTVTLGGVKKVATTRSALDRLGVQKPEVSTTTHMDAVGMKSKVQDRLGGAEPVAWTLATGTVKLASDRPAVKKSMQARLGAPTSAVKASNIKKEPAVKQTVTVTLGGKPSAMQKQLGTTVVGASKSVASPAMASTKVLKRLGAPVGSQVPKKKSAVQDRLGLMRAEATSTTPSITVTMGGPGALKKKTTGVASKQNVFSRLGS